MMLIKIQSVTSWWLLIIVSFYLFIYFLFRFVRSRLSFEDTTTTTINEEEEKNHHE